MMKKRAQFTLRTSKMSDEVYQFFENLSKKRQLTSFLIQAAEKEIHGYRNTDEVNLLIQEIRGLKEFILQNGVSVSGPKLRSQEDTSKPMVQLSTDEKKGSLDQDDVDYGDL